MVASKETSQPDPDVPPGLPSVGSAARIAGDAAASRAEDLVGALASRFGERQEEDGRYPPIAAVIPSATSVPPANQRRRRANALLVRNLPASTAARSA